MISGSGYQAVYAAGPDDESPASLDVICWEKEDGSAGDRPPRITGWVIPVGHTGHEAGDLVAAPYLMLRGEDGTVRAFRWYTRSNGRDTW